MGVNLKAWNTGQIHFHKERRKNDPEQYFPRCVLGVLINILVGIFMGAV